MTSRLDLSGKRVLVTGASSGLGLEMARQLARDHHAHPILVARRKDRLDALQTELSKLGVTPEVIVADMTKPEDLSRMFDEATKKPVAGVILNAGVTFFGHAVEQTPESVATLISTNVHGVVDLSLKFIRHFQTRKEPGALLLISSMASLQPMPYQAAYGGSKAFVTSFGLALSEELRGSPITVTTFCPGGIATEMIDAAGMGDKYKKGHPMVMDVEPCAALALSAFLNRETISVPGTLNKMAAAAVKFAPKSLVAMLVANDYRGVLPKR